MKVHCRKKSCASLRQAHRQGSGYLPFLTSMTPYRRSKREAALGFVPEQLAILFDQAIPPILSVSSTDGLKAELSRDQALLDASGIPELEAQLLSFLLAEKNSQLLMRMCDRASEFLRALPDAPEIEHLVARIDDLGQKFGRQYRSLATRPRPMELNLLC